MEHAYDIKDSGLEEIELKKKISKNENVDDLEFNEDEISTDSNEIVKKKIKSSSNDPDFDETESNASSESELISGRKVKPKDKTNLLGRKRKRTEAIVRKAPKSNSDSFAGDYLARPFATGLGAGIPITAVFVPILLISSKKISSATNTLKNTSENISRIVNEKGVPALDNISAAANNIKNLASTADNAIKNKVVPAIDKVSAAADKLKDVVGTADDAIKKDIVPAIASLKDLSERAKVEINGLGTDARALVNEARHEINRLSINANLFVQNLSDKLSRIVDNNNISKVNQILTNADALMYTLNNKVHEVASEQNVQSVNQILTNADVLIYKLNTKLDKIASDNNIRNVNKTLSDINSLITSITTEINQLTTNTSDLIQNLNDKVNKIGSNENITNLNLIMGYGKSLMNKADNKIFNTKGINNVNGIIGNGNQISNRINNLRNQNNNNDQPSNGVSRLEQLNKLLSEENLSKTNRLLSAGASVFEKLDTKFASDGNLNLANSTISNFASLMQKTNNFFSNGTVNKINIIKNTVNKLLSGKNNNINNEAENNNLINQNSQQNMEENLNDMVNNVNNFLVSTNNLFNSVNNVVVKLEKLLGENKRLATFIGKVLAGNPGTMSMLKEMKTNIQAIVDWIENKHEITVRSPKIENNKLAVTYQNPWFGRTGFKVTSTLETTSKQNYLDKVTEMIVKDGGLEGIEIEFNSNCPQDKKMNIGARNIYFSDTVAELFGAFVYNTNKDCENHPLLAANLKAVQNVLEAILPVVLGEGWITNQLINLISWLANTKYIEDGDGFCPGKVGTGTFKRFTMLGGTVPTGLSSTSSDFLYNGINEASKQQDIKREKINKIARIYEMVLERIMEPEGKKLLFTPRLFALLTVMCFPVSEENQNAQQ